MRQLKIKQDYTNRTSVALDKYLLDIAHEPMISIEEEIELARRIKEGDEEAKQKLVTANLRFVVSVAKQYQHRGMPLDDLIAEGNIGLIKAAELFDETRGFKFISYAVWWIRQSILDAIGNKSRVVRLPVSKENLLRNVNKIRQDYLQDYNREPSPEELSDVLEIPVSQINEVLAVSKRARSIDSPFDNEDDNSLVDVLPSKTPDTDHTVEYDESLHIDITTALNSLPMRCRDIIKMYFGIGCNNMGLTEIGKHFGLTRERTRQLVASSLQELSTGRSAQVLKSYL